MELPWADAVSAASGKGRCAVEHALHEKVG